MNLKALFRKKSVAQIVREVEAYEAGEIRLKKVLGVWDLTAFGVAAIVGAGIFSTIGNAAFSGGPAVIFLFIFTAIACGFSALCYAEFASSLPIAGSAYTYAYASFGEILAWIIGWDLLMEYAISNIAVAISWSEYFNHILVNYGIHLPKYLTMDFLTAHRGFEKALQSGASLLASGAWAPELPNTLLDACTAWTQAPRVLGVPIICNLPALFITAIVTAVAYFGIRESKLASNVLVGLKVAVILLVIGLGTFYIHPENWIPFAPNGVGGVFKGVSAVFFAYIGFDAISTTAEECKNPQRDLPRGMIYSLIICTTLYVLMSLVLTGMVKYEFLDVGDPLAFVFGPQGANLPWVSALIAISAVVALFTVLLVYQLGQPRIWMAMSRDGLLPPIFAALHPKFHTPWFSTLFTGVLVAIPSLFMNLTEVTELTSTGTLFAFSLVCGGVLKIGPEQAGAPERKFRMPYIHSKFIFPALVALGLTGLVYFNFTGIQAFFAQPPLSHLNSLSWDLLPMILYCIEIVFLVYFCFTRNWSLIPVLGLASCTYLMTELGMTNWIRFGVWLLTGFVVYFFYGARNSRLATSRASSTEVPTER